MMRKLMLIDDDEWFCILLKSNLEARGDFSVVTTSDAQSAVTLAKIVSPDLILLDVIMPTMDGMALADSLDSDELTTDIPVAFLTSAVSAENVRTSDGRMGHLYLLSKLSTTVDLMESIEDILQERNV